MKTHWKKHYRGCYQLIGDDRIWIHRWGPTEWWTEIGGPPLWPLVDVARACRTSCGGVRLHFQSLAEAMRMTKIYLRQFYRPPGPRQLRVVSVLEFTMRPGALPSGEIELDPYDSNCVAIWSTAATDGA
jgi:hypothetical protein